MALFIRYVKQNRKTYIVLLLMVILFAASFWLYRLPVKAVLYPAALCFAAGGIYVCYDFLQMKHRHIQLQNVDSMADVAAKRLPKAKNVEAEDYEKIIEALYDEHYEAQSSMDARFREMVDYYTVWAHQIKTPIASMGLRLQNEDSDLSRKLSMDLLRVEQYVEMVLMFLRLDSDSTDYVFKEYELDGIVRSAVKKFAGEFIQRKIRLNYRPLNTSVITDEKWLTFVVEQILSNALKYTPAAKYPLSSEAESGGAGSGEGTISIYMEAPKILCIADTGIGIAPEDLPRIFEKGYTGYNGRTDKKASGIGLYLCRKICGNLGHRIWAESVPEQGTTIKIDLDQTKNRPE